MAWEAVTTEWNIWFSLVVRIMSSVGRARMIDSMSSCMLKTACTVVSLEFGTMVVLSMVCGIEALIFIRCRCLAWFARKVEKLLV